MVLFLIRMVIVVAIPGLHVSPVHRLCSLKCVNLFRKLITILVWGSDAQPSGMSCRLETHDLRLISSHNFTAVWKGRKYGLKMEALYLNCKVLCLTPAVASSK